MKLSTAAQLLNGQLIGKDQEFSGVCIDTRKIQPGELFIAIPGKQFDGHDFIDAAEKKKAVAAMLQRSSTTSLPHIQVKDTIESLGQLAKFHRQQFHLPLIGLTGSCGKTTVKMLIANILSQLGATLANESSFNNEIGTPLTLLRLKSKHRYAVVEMGTNHFGEIAYLTQLAKPNIALITNAAAAHLEGLMNIEGVARAKGEIFQGLSTDGIAIVNADDKHANYWKELIYPRKLYSFGLTQPADFTARDIILNQEGKAQFNLIAPQGEVLIFLPLLGRHNVANALAASAAAYAAGAPLTAIKSGLEASVAVSKRLVEYKTPNNARLIDDSYNANPLSVQAAIELLAQCPGETILILGDMHELGTEAINYHITLGQKAKELGINRLFTYGKLSEYTAESFGTKASHFNDQDALITAVKSLLNAQTTLLIKGSRSTHMENIVQALIPLVTAQSNCH